MRMNQNHLEGLLKFRWLGSTLRVSNSKDLEWVPRISFPSVSQVMLMLFYATNFENYRLGKKTRNLEANNLDSSLI